ncbi:MAG: MFS transporter [Fimbriimonadaceae bacterium]|nr:MFS transporter [Fimbriimonadaceae bacterium]QYK57878.1 MAG: MFS transporter [Fimbriimonadaceae bacterium]
MVPGLRALESPAFRRLWIGQTVSQFGDAVYGLLFIFMASKLTENDVIVGLVAALTALPYFFPGPLAGVLADRLDRRTVLVWSDLASIIILGAFLLLLVFTGDPPVWTLLVTPCLLSTANVFFFPARAAAVPRLVPEDRLYDATALGSATMNLMQLIGLGLAAGLLGPLEKANPTVFFPLAIGINMATFAVSALFLRSLPPLPPEEKREKHDWKAELAEGFQTVWRHGVLRPILLANMAASLSIGGFMVAYTATNRAWFDGKFATLAWIEVAFVVSMLVGSLAVAQARVSRVGAAYAVGTFIVGLTVILMGYSQIYGWFVFWNIVAGLALPIVTVPTPTYMNLAVSDSVRGRVNSFSAMVSAGVQPIGAGIVGVGLDRLGITTVYVVMGLGLMAAGLAPLASRQFREARMPSSA